MYDVLIINKYFEPKLPAHKKVYSKLRKAIMYTKIINSKRLSFEQKVQEIKKLRGIEII